MTIMDIGIFSGFTPDKDSLVEVNRKKIYLCFRNFSSFVLLSVQISGMRDGINFGRPRAISRAKF